MDLFRSVVDMSSAVALFPPTQCIPVPVSNDILMRSAIRFTRGETVRLYVCISNQALWK